jgi:hypothetical protein
MKLISALPILIGIHRAATVFHGGASGLPTCGVLAGQHRDAYVELICVTAFAAGGLVPGRRTCRQHD